MGESIIAIIALASLVLAPSVLGVQAVEAAYTPDGGGFPLCSFVDINSPRNSTCYSSVLTLSVSVRGMLAPQFYTYTLVYSIDGKANVTLHVISTFVPVMATRTYANGTTENVVSSFASYYLISGCASLPELPMGSHTLTVYARYDRFNDGNTNWPKLLLDKTTVEFTVNSIATFNDAFADPLASSDNTTLNPPTCSNTTTSDLEPSETNINGYHSTITGQADTPYSLIGVLSVVLVVMAIAIFAKRKRKTERDAPFPHKK